jgi:uncharacterized damage-inducible protein DinB
MAGMAGELFRYHAWANRRLIEFCAALSEAELATRSPTAYGSIRDTLAHMVGAEGHFAYGVTGGWVDPPLEPGTTATLAELADRADRTGAALAAAADRFGPTDEVTLRRRGEERRMPAAAVLATAIYHGGEHRAQVCATLHSIGIKPPDLSGWRFGGDRSGDYDE